jgi:hypothetical protein
MGLDMYLQGRAFIWNLNGKPETRDGFKLTDVTLELGYWRKHPDLHGYIVQTFAGGIDECQEIPLTAENLIDIIAAIEEKRLPHTTGFFFGASEPDDDAPSIEIFRKALAWLEGVPKLNPMENPESIGDGMTIQKVRLDVLPDLKESREILYHASW